MVYFPCVHGNHIERMESMGITGRTVKKNLRHDPGGDEIAERIPADEARVKLGDVIDRALSGERIVITRHAKDHAVVLSYRDYVDLLALSRDAKSKKRGAA